MTPVEMSLQVMWKGMVGILIVIAIIIVSTYLLHFIVNKCEKFKQDRVAAKLEQEQANSDGKES